MVSKPLYIQMFGDLAVRVGDGPVVAIPSQQTGALLAYLALNLKRTHTREALADLFWPDDEAEDSRHKLRQRLHVLRKQLESPPLDAGSVLVTTRTTVHLDPKAVVTDVSAFSEAIAAAAKTTIPDDRARLLEHAAKLYRGDLLAGFYMECFAAEQARLSVTLQGALHDLALAHEECGEFDRGIDSARRLVSINPLNEEAHCDLMRLFAAKGQPSAVVRQYREMERVLATELGETPSDTARQLMESLRESGMSRVAARPEAGNGNHEKPRRSLPGSATQAGSRSRNSKLRLGLAGVSIAIAGVALFTKMHGPTLPVKPKVPPGSQRWMARYTPAPDEHDSEPTALVTDKDGSTIVTGFVQTDKNDVDFLTLKYDSAGSLLWRKRYNGSGNDVDRARCVVGDDLGNVYVTGESDNGKGNDKTRLSGTDFATIKYDSAGNQVWAVRYNGPDNGEDWPVGIALDDANGVFVLGRSWGHQKSGKPGFEYALVKYSANGKEEWAARYGNGHGSDTPAAMFRQKDGAIIVTGTSRAEPRSGPESDFLTIKYAPDGTKLWEARYGAGNQSDDLAFTVGADGGGNVMVLGQGRGAPGTLDETRSGCITVKYTPSGQLQWVRGTTAESDRIGRIIAASTGGGSLICGSGVSATGGAAVTRTVERDENGLVKWVKDYGDGPGDNIGPTSMRSYPYGLYIAGIRGTARTLGDYYVVKYDHSGQRQWIETYDGKHQDDYLRAMTLDKYGRPIVAGTCNFGTSRDTVIIAYNH